MSFLFLGQYRHSRAESWIASSQRPIAVRALRLKDYFTAPVRGAFEHLVGLPAFVEPEHFTNLSL